MRAAEPSIGWSRGEDKAGDWALALVVFLAVGLVLRLWGIKHGLPYVYNLDEGAHFVPKAIAYFQGTFNPNYFVNPPAYGYVLHFVFAVWFGGRDGASEAYATDQEGIFALARVVTALLGVAGLVAIYAAGRRLYDARVGAIAAGIVAVGFLPVYYSKLALNDVPTLLPIGVALYGAAGLLSRDRRRDWVYAGVGLGAACAIKYTAGIVVLPILIAAGYRLIDPARRGGGEGSGGLGVRLRRLARWRGGVAIGLPLVGVATIGVFFAGNPYAFFDWSAFWDGISRQQTAAGDLGKLGQSEPSGHLYYLWTLTWGLGWGVALAALAGVFLSWRDCLARFLFLVPAPVLFVLYMGAHDRFFGRWLIPVLPFVALLAAFCAVWVWEAARRWGEASGRGPGPRRWVAIGFTVALLAQGLVYSVHGGIVLAREDTRNEARRWLVDNVPAGGKLVIEPIVPQAYVQDAGRPHPVTPVGDRWIKYPSGKSMIENDGTPVHSGRPRVVNVEDFERVTRPTLLRSYRARGFCWVVIGSTQYGRAFAEPAKVPAAIRYYRELNRTGTPVFAALPYGRQARVPFNFDWSFDYYPLAYDRPGPEVFVYRTAGPLCEPLPARSTVSGLSISAQLDD